MPRKRILLGLSLITLVGIVTLSILFFSFFFPVGKMLTASTNLDREALGPFLIHEPLNKSDLDLFDSYEKRKESSGYSYSSEDAFISTNDQQEIISISSGEQLRLTSTITTGNTKEKVLQTYGQNYYTYKEMGLGDAVVYIDRKNKIELTLWMREEKVWNIWISSYK
ncbi:hypothetical protein [Alkalicoccobacillus porphyridii]|uniref:Uncharacterized protein n=1 Tax=Alkalicoccobacillus porphyridii TaxID=2597270 RepID=A0A553ZTM4_9BACI|nr:hypothetical protein [Alkalicoccobacillus porphyridii]TSB44829.1 hypothetical protein FN960_19115 [Alkalicoccobacillus porphyridii]